MHNTDQTKNWGFPSIHRSIDNGFSSERPQVSMNMKCQNTRQMTNDWYLEEVTQNTDSKIPIK